MNKRIGERGLIRGIFVILLLVAAVFLLISFGKPYYRSYVLGSHTRDFLKSEIGNVADIRAKVMEEAVELNVPLEEENLEVVLDKKVIKVNASWTDTVDFWGYYQTKIDFSMYEEY